jgi:haloalkane dehalogenase
MASAKGLKHDVRKGLTAPYNTWHNRMATLRFVQDIPVFPNDNSYSIVKHADQHLEALNTIPMLILWGENDFVFDMDYFAEWRRRFPAAEAHTFSDAGHYILEDEPKSVIEKMGSFLN